MSEFFDQEQTSFSPLSQVAEAFLRGDNQAFDRATAAYDLTLGNKELSDRSIARAAEAMTIHDHTAFQKAARQFDAIKYAPYRNATVPIEIKPEAKTGMADKATQIVGSMVLAYYQSSIFSELSDKSNDFPVGPSLLAWFYTTNRSKPDFSASDRRFLDKHGIDYGGSNA